MFIKFVEILKIRLKMSFIKKVIRLNYNALLSTFAQKL